MKTVVKLTQESVVAEVENILDTYPNYPYQQTFAIPDLRKDLIAYVLDHIPSLRSGINVEKAWAAYYKLPRTPLEQQLHLQSLIHQGIYSIMQEKSDAISEQFCETIQPACEPSHWFG